MPSVREVHDAFSDLISAQDALLASTRAEIREIEISAERFAGTASPAIIAAFECLPPGKAGLLILADAGNAVPLKTYDRTLRGYANDAEARRGEFSRMQAKFQAARESRDHTVERVRFIANQANDRLAGIAAASGYAPPSINSPIDPRLQRLVSSAATRKWPPNVLQAIISADAKLLRTSALAYPGDLFADALRWKLNIELCAKNIAAAEAQKEVLNAAAIALAKRFPTGQPRQDTSPTDKEIETALISARHDAMRSSLQKDGALALMKVDGGQHITQNILSSILAYVTLGSAKAAVEARLEAISRFRNQLSSQMPKLTKGKRAAPSKSIRVDLGAIKESWNRIKEGSAVQAAATTSLQRLKQAVIEAENATYPALNSHQVGDDGLVMWTALAVAFFAQDDALPHHNAASHVDGVHSFQMNDTSHIGSSFDVGSFSMPDLAAVSFDTFSIDIPTVSVDVPSFDSSSHSTGDYSSSSDSSSY